MFVCDLKVSKNMGKSGTGGKKINIYKEAGGKDLCPNSYS